MTSRPAKRKNINNDDDNDVEMSVPPATRKIIRSMRSPEKKRRSSSIETGKSEHEVRCESLYQQAMEQLNSDMGDWCQQMLDQLNSSTPTSGPPMTLQLPMCEYIRANRLIKSLYKREHGHVMTNGSDDMLQLGMPLYKSQIMTESPRLIKNLNGVVMVAAGGLHNVAVFQNGSVYSWGSNDEGSLGRETQSDVDEQTPQLVKGFTPSGHCQASDTFPYTNEDNSIIAVAAGATHTLYLSITGLVYMTGDLREEDGVFYRDRRPPDDTTVDIPREETRGKEHDVRGRHFNPTHVYQLTQKVKKISAGANYSAALYQDGETIVTWGISFKGEMARSRNMTTTLDKKGNPDLQGMLPKKVRKPDEPEGDDDTPENRAEYQRDLKQYHEVDVPNYNKALKVLEEKFLRPHPVVWAGPAIKKMVLDLACGDYHLLVVARPEGQFDSVVYTSGLNQYGQLGHGDKTQRNELTPVKALDGKNIVQVAGGHHHSLVLDITGKAVYAFGRSDYGQLGNGIAPAGLFEALPVRVHFPENDAPFTFTQVSCGGHHCAVVTDRGDLYTWGYGDTGALGHGGDKDEGHPRKVKVTRNLPDQNSDAVVRQVDGGGQHTVMIVTMFPRE